MSFQNLQLSNLWGAIDACFMESESGRHWPTDVRLADGQRPVRHIDFAQVVRKYSSLDIVR